MKVVRRVLIALAFVAAVIALFPLAAIEVLYRYGLPKGGPLPEVPAVTLPELVREAVWLAAGEKPERSVQPMYPSTIIETFRHGIRDRPPGDSAAALASRLATIMDPHPMLTWHLAHWARWVWLTRNMTSDQLVQFIAEKSYFGHQIYGLQAAAAAYYGKDIASLASEQIALLVSLPNAPTRRDPECHQDNAIKGRRWILQRLREAGSITSAAFTELDARPLSVLPSGKPCPQAPGSSAPSAPNSARP